MDDDRSPWQLSPEIAGEGEANAVTEQPDTAAIRALLSAGIYVDYHDGLALCDALDAARAERDDIRKAAEGDAGKWLTTTLLRDRTKAELEYVRAGYAEERARAEAAEARITATLEFMDPAEQYELETVPALCRELENIRDILNAGLTGGTE